MALEPVSPDVAKSASVTAESYEAMYAASVKDPAAFWDDHGRRIDARLRLRLSAPVAHIQRRVEGG